MQVPVTQVTQVSFLRIPEKCYLIMILIGASLFPSGTEHLSIC